MGMPYTPPEMEQFEKDAMDNWRKLHPNDTRSDEEIRRG